MAAFVVPVNLADSVRADPVPGRRDWLRLLPEIVGAQAERWSLRVGEPYQPGGRCAWVAPVRDVAGQDLVLKVAWRHDEAAHEADALRAWAGQGAVRLHDSEVFGSTSVLLLERCRPGTTLAQALPEPEQDEVVAGLLRRLWVAPTAGFSFRPLQVMCDAWAAEFEEQLAVSASRLDPGLARAGIELLRTLPATAERQVLLCTDLHAGNVLAARGEPWLVIDPKPYLGDPTYDALQHLLNCEERLVADPAGLARRLADLLGLDPDRLICWLFARCVQESIDQPVLGEVAAHLAPG
ncbi:aminoglycoside phosphotransferase family protein [Rhizocola hellebori]|uniref:aminoglycoside phosphotransferase family protein n=1 Tax=Rhizocola hellebori TaxID=1392758 RepID=UPI0019441AEF|nr:aminoglycoside phosphotransferase family protein [Rhizocola hellebori]